MASRLLLLVLGCLLPATVLSKGGLPSLEPAPSTPVPAWSERSVLGHTHPALQGTANQDTAWFGGTVWAADSMRWEAIPGGTWTFDSGVGSHFDHSAEGVDPFKDQNLHAYMEGWVGVDISRVDAPYFRRMTTSDFAGTPCVGAAAGLGGSASLWVGVTTAEAESLCYAAGRGYGEYWNVCMEQEFVYNGTGGVNWSYDYVNDTEEGFDYSYAMVDTSDTEDPVELWRVTGTESGSASLPLVPGESLRSNPGPVVLRFCFRSDGAYSDQDGSFATDCGPLAIDDISVTGGGIAHVATFESGADGWTLMPEVPGPGGDWSDLRNISSLTNPVSIPCDAYCGVQDTVLVFENQSGALGSHGFFQNNLALSPWIDLRAEGLQGAPIATMTYDVVNGNGILNYIFSFVAAQWYPEACVNNGKLQTSPVVELPSIFPITFIGCSTVGNPVGWDLSGIIPASAEQVRVGIVVREFCRFFVNCTGVSNSTPWFDNVRFGVAGAPGSVSLSAESLGQPQDAFPEDGTLSPSSTARIDAARTHGAAAGDTLFVKGFGASTEVQAVFAVSPGPGIDTARLASWLTSHTLEGTWQGLSWYSARMDTAEIGGAAATGYWMTAYHEEDPNFSGTDTATDPNDLDPDGYQNRLLNDLFPDDLLTPGSRLCLYFKGKSVSGTSWFCYPDTTNGGYLEMEVLPSSMGADSTFNCVLYVDYADGMGAQPCDRGLHSPTCFPAHPPTSRPRPGIVGMCGQRTLSMRLSAVPSMRCVGRRSRNSWGTPR